MASASRTDALLAALCAEIERHRPEIDRERGLRRVEFSIQFRGKTAWPYSVVYRLEAGGEPIAVGDTRR